MNSCFHGDDDLYFLTQEHSARRWNKTRAVYAYVYAASQRDGGTALLHQWVIVSAPAQTPPPQKKNQAVKLAVNALLLGQARSLCFVQLPLF